MNYFGIYVNGLWAMLALAALLWAVSKVSGVAMLERTIGERRPAYQDYTERTNSFIPGPSRPAAE